MNRPMGTEVPASTVHEELILKLVRRSGWVLTTVLFLITLALAVRLGVGMAGAATGSMALATSIAPAQAASTPANASSNGAILAQPVLPMSGVPGSGSASARSDSNTSTADFLAALSAAIAVMTLVLTLGVPWLYEKIDAVRRIALEADRAVAAAKEAIDRADRARVQQQSLHLLQSLSVAAQAAVVRLVDSWGGAQTNASAAQLVGLYLQGLQSEDASVRYQAFCYLYDFPWSSPLTLMESDITTPIWRYQVACHRYHALNQGIPEDRVMNQSGIWCLFWDRAEQSRINQPGLPPALGSPVNDPPLPQ